MVSVYAAGSLRAPMSRIAKAFEASNPGVTVSLVFGASGLLRDRLAKGERADVFASANMEHPQSLSKAGAAEAPARFTRNALCVLAAPSFDLRGEPLAKRLLDPAVRVGTSTPKADPSGDYAFEMFDRIERTGAGPGGSAAALKAKALQLTGGPNSPPPPTDRNVYGAIVAAGQADVFVTYCTNAAIAVREQPALRTLQVPASINVYADYGLALMATASPVGRSFADFVLGPQGQAQLAADGFQAK